MKSAIQVIILTLIVSILAQISISTYFGYLDLLAHLSALVSMIIFCAFVAGFIIIRKYKYKGSSINAPIVSTIIAFFLYYPASFKIIYLLLMPAGSADQSIAGNGFVYAFRSAFIERPSLTATSISLIASILPAIFLFLLSIILPRGFFQMELGKSWIALSGNVGRKEAFRRLKQARFAAIWTTASASFTLLLLGFIARLGVEMPNPAPGQPVALTAATTPLGHETYLSAVATPDGGVAVYRGEARLGMVRGHGAPIVEAAFLGDGQALLTLDARGEARTTNLAALPARSAFDMRAPLATLQRELWAPYGFPVAREVHGWPLNPAVTAWPAAIGFALLTVGLMTAPYLQTLPTRLNPRLAQTGHHSGGSRNVAHQRPALDQTLMRFKSAAREFDGLFEACVKKEPWEVEKELGDQMRSAAQKLVSTGKAYKIAFLDSLSGNVREANEAWQKGIGIPAWRDHIGSAEDLIDGVMLTNWIGIPGNVQASFVSSGAYSDVYDHCEGRIRARLSNIHALTLPSAEPFRQSIAIPEMVSLPPGRFLMGAAEGEDGAFEDEYPRHEVIIAHRLAIGKYPVTFAQWDAALEAGATLPHLDDNGFDRGDRPAINVSWEEAQAYIGWLNDQLGLTGRPDAYRLPSESEWEYACRAGTQTRFSFGDEDRHLGDHAWFSGNSGGTSQPVGRKKPNGFGLYDMHGNVFEWCADSWHQNYEGSPKDGSDWQGGDNSRRVLRGGSWCVALRYLRSANRYGETPKMRLHDMGFRLARTISP